MRYTWDRLQLVVWVWVRDQQRLIKRRIIDLWIIDRFLLVVFHKLNRGVPQLSDCDIYSFVCEYSLVQQNVGVVQHQLSEFQFR